MSMRQNHTRFLTMMSPQETAAVSTSRSFSGRQVDFKLNFTAHSEEFPAEKNTKVKTLNTFRFIQRRTAPVSVTRSQLVELTKSREDRYVYLYTCVYLYTGQASPSSSRTQPQDGELEVNLVKARDEVFPEGKEALSLHG